MEIRFAKREEVGYILSLIQELSIHEGRRDEVVATVESMEEWIFDKERATIIIGEDQGEIVGYSIYHYTYSTYMGCSGIFIEDIFVKSEHRGKGYGKAFLTYAVELAKKEKLGRIEWTCLPSNVGSVAFYESMGARVYDTSMHFRLEEKELEAFQM